MWNAETEDNFIQRILSEGLYDLTRYPSPTDEDYAAQICAQKGKLDALKEMPREQLNIKLAFLAADNGHLETVKYLLDAVNEEYDRLQDEFGQFLSECNEENPSCNDEYIRLDSRIKTIKAGMGNDEIRLSIFSTAVENGNIEMAKEYIPSCRYSRYVPKYAQLTIAAMYNNDLEMINFLQEKEFAIRLTEDIIQNALLEGKKIDIEVQKAVRDIDSDYHFNLKDYCI